MDKTRLYLQHKKDIETIAKTFTKRIDMDYEDLVCEGNLFFCEILEKFDPGKGEFKNYFIKSLFDHYRTMARKQRLEFAEGELDEIPDIKLQEFEENFSEKTKELVGHIFNPSVDFLRFEVINLRKSTDKSNRPPKRTLTQQMIYNYLRIEGWSNKEINYCFNEIKAVI